MRILMMGTGPFAVPTLATLLDARHDVPALVTRPTAPPKGKEKTPLNPMRQLAEARGIPVHAPENINTFQSRQQLADLHPELLVVCDYGQILASETLSVAPW